MIAVSLLILHQRAVTKKLAQRLGISIKEIEEEVKREGWWKQLKNLDR